jgi:ketopantoate reductase
MKILMVGTDAVSLLYGALFAEAGHEVAHFAPPCDAPAPAGLRVRLLDGRGKQSRQRLFTSTPRAVNDCHAGVYDLLVVHVRYGHLTETLPLVARRDGDADVLLFGHLWEDLHTVDEFLPRSRYVLGYPAAAAALTRKREELDAALSARHRIGCAGADGAAALERVAALFSSAGLEPIEQADMPYWLWAAFAISAGFAGAASQARGDRPTRSSATLREAVFAVRDALRVVERRGADVTAFGSLRPFYLPSYVAACMMKLTMRRSPVDRRIMELPADPTELRRIITHTLATARQLGVDVPRLEALAESVVGAPAA